jgi:choline dehydrogenase
VTVYDAVIVGAGSAGVVIASRLAEAGAHVLLLESGKWATGNRAVDHPSSWFLLQGSELDWNYTTEAATHASGKVFAWPRGRAVGGSSVINAMIWLRGHARDFDQWAASGLKGWSWDDLLPFFKRSESWQGPASEFHGSDGPVTVTPDARPSLAARAFVQAAVSAGFDLNPDFNDGDSIGAGFFPHSIKAGVRESVATAYLPGQVLPAQLDLLVGVQVQRLIFEDETCVGVAYVDPEGAEHEVWAALTILSAGAIGSPKLLLQSGVGPRENLETLGIPVVADLPVGQNLQDHIAACVAVQSDADLEIDPNSALGEAGLFTWTEAAAQGSPPDLQFTFAPIVLTGEPPEPGVIPPSGFTLMPIVARPESRGRVSLRSAKYLDAPLIETNYLENPADRQVLREGVRLAFDILRREPLASLASTLIQPANQPTTDEEIDELIDRSLITFYHPSGTCSMGAAGEGVVDAELRVHGISGLRVVDASVMPTIPSANINAVVIGIAEKIAARLCGEYVTHGTTA